MKMSTVFAVYSICLERVFSSMERAIDFSIDAFKEEIAAEKLERKARRLRPRRYRIKRKQSSVELYVNGKLNTIRGIDEIEFD